MNLEWNFNRIPEIEIPNIKKMVQINDESGLIQLHNEYKISKRVYCCVGQGVLNHFKNFIDEIDDGAKER